MSTFDLTDEFVAKIREPLGLGGIHIDNLPDLIDDLAAEVQKLRANLERCFGGSPTAYMELGQQLVDAEEKIKKLREQATCGHSPWPTCHCGYKGAGFCG